MAVGERECFHGSGAVLVGLRFADTYVRAVEAVAVDIAAFERYEFAAAECAGVAHQEQRSVAAFEDLRRPPGPTSTRVIDDRSDVGGQQRCARVTGPLPRRRVIPPNTRESGAHHLVPARVVVAGSAVAVRDRRDPFAERRRRIRPRPVDGERVGSRNEIGRHRSGMRRQRVVPGDGAPGLEASPRRIVGAAGSTGPCRRHRPFDPSGDLARQVRKHLRTPHRDD